MKTIIDFTLNVNIKITIIIPEVSSKFNYYYEPTEKLNQFDEATVYFINSANKLELYKDVLDDALFSLNGSLRKAVSNTLLLPKTIAVGTAGYVFNNMLNGVIDIELEHLWVWSMRGISTLIYTINNTIYLEIVPIYPWTFSEPGGDNYISFDEFMKNYKPYVVEIIPHETALQWIKTSEEYLKIIGCIPYLKKLD